MRKQTPSHQPRFKQQGQALCPWLLSCLAWLGMAGAAFAQFPAGSNGLGGLIVADRSKTRILREAQELVAAGKYLDALGYLQALLEQNEDLLLRPGADDNSGVFRSMKSEVQRIIENLSPEGREVYLTNTSPVASALLKEAVEQNDEHKLTDVARLYFHTPAGYEATYRMGLKQFDHGEPMQAALLLRRLQRNPEVAKRFEPLLSLRIALCWMRAGMPNEANSVLQTLKTSGQAQTVMLAGRERDLFTDQGEPSKWLSELINEQAAPQYANKTDWLMAGGGPSRNAILPVPVAIQAETWQAATVVDSYFKNPDDPLETPLDVTLRSLVSEQKNFRSNSSQHRLPSRQPLVVDGMLIFRKLPSVGIYDLESGDFLFETCGWDFTLQKLVDPNESELIPNWKMYLGQLLNQRLWDDSTFGRMSSDGEQLYCVEDAGFWSPISTGQNRLLPVSSNSVLNAHNLVDGRLVWEVGGPTKPGDGEPRPLAGRYFLGTPMPLGGRLYCLADMNQEIQLNVLDAATGNLEWSQPLATPMQLTIDQDRARRTSGVSVAYGDGVLVCPTDAGAIVALDLTSRSLLWGFPTESAGGNANDNVQAFRGNRLQPADPTGEASLPSGWIDSTPLIIGDKVILTPLRSAKLFLLDLQTGKRIWQQPRGQGLYVAGILNNMVIVVGTKNVQTWNLHNDQTGWRDPLMLSAVPTGRGVIVGTNLLLPAGQQLLVVDLKTGTERKPIPVAETIALGNLVVAQGRLISQGVSTLDVLPFPNLEETVGK